MRTIKFRGKTISGEWAYGLLCKEEQSGNWFVSNAAGSPKAFAVLPSSIGQFTGEIDSDGKEIFEGDVVKIPYIFIEGYLGDEEIATDVVLPVIFEKGVFSTSLGHAISSEWHTHGIFVIGNVHEAPYHEYHPTVKTTL